MKAAAFEFATSIDGRLSVRYRPQDPEAKTADWLLVDYATASSSVFQTVEAALHALKTRGGAEGWGVTPLELWAPLSAVMSECPAEDFLGTLHRLEARDLDDHRYQDRRARFRWAAWRVVERALRDVKARRGWPSRRWRVPEVGPDRESFLGEVWALLEGRDPWEGFMDYDERAVLDLGICGRVVPPPESPTWAARV